MTFLFSWIVFSMTAVAPAGDQMYNQQQAGYGQPPPPSYGQSQAGYGQTQYGMQGTPMTRQPGAPPPSVPGQPQQVVWMQRPQLIPGCPPGLEYLTQIDQLLVKQQFEILEMLTGWETSNKYKIKNSVGQQVYFAAEESDVCMRQCCGPSRGFTMHITDNMGQEVIRVNREFKCCAGCQWCACVDCCAFEISVEAPVGTTVGYVRQMPSYCAPKYSIMNADRQEILNIEGPVCICQGICCTWDQEFIVRSPDKQHEVGKISKQWSGLMREMFTDSDNFGVSFPMDLDVKMKAVMIGAVFLIDFMFFEHSQNQQNQMYY